MTPRCMLHLFYLTLQSGMVIKSVLFSGHLAAGNVLEVQVDETYLPLRFGEWRMRIDTLAVTLKNRGDSFHVALSCSLLQSAQEVSVQGRKVKQIRPTPLYVFSLPTAKEDGEKRNPLYARDGAWFNFTNGCPRFELQFRNLSDANNRETQLEVHGIILFECLG